MTSCCTPRASYGKYLYIGSLTAILLHAVAFALWPEYVPRAYRLRKVDLPPTRVIDIVLELPSRPREVPRPEVPMEFESSDDADPEETILHTVFQPDDPPIEIPVPRTREAGAFITSKPSRD